MQAECKEIAGRLPHDDECGAALARAAVRWGELNPDPVKLRAPNYSR